MTGQQQTLTDPIALTGSLSPGNAKATWDNVWACTTIPSVREIVVVHFTRVLAELLRREVDSHRPEQTEEIEPDGTLRLESIGFACGLRDACAPTISPEAPPIPPAARAGVVGDHASLAAPRRKGQTLRP
jgi:hypothetical protein